MTREGAVPHADTRREAGIMTKTRGAHSKRNSRAGFGRRGQGRIGGDNRRTVPSPHTPAKDRKPRTGRRTCTGIANAVEGGGKAGEKSAHERANGLRRESRCAAEGKERPRRRRRAPEKG